MTNIVKLNTRPATDYKWKSRGEASDGTMVFEHHSDQEQRIKDLESGAAICTPEEDATIRKLFMQTMGIKDADGMNEAATKDNERIQKKLDNKNKF